MEFFRNTNIDFLGYKWYFLSFSLIFSVAGILSMVFWHGIPLGVDFRGGTVVEVKFADKPDNSVLRSTLDKAGLHNAVIQNLDPGSNEVLIKLDLKETKESDLDKGRTDIINTLETNPVPGKQNINNSDRIGLSAVRDSLIKRDPMHAAPTEYEKYARQVVDVRDKVKGGILRSLDEVKGAVPDPVVES